MIQELAVSSVQWQQDLTKEDQHSLDPHLWSGHQQLALDRSVGPREEDGEVVTHLGSEIVWLVHQMILDVDSDWTDFPATTDGGLILPLVSKLRTYNSNNNTVARAARCDGVLAVLPL